jgi:hypothetical protein
MPYLHWDTEKGQRERANAIDLHLRNPPNSPKRHRSSTLVGNLRQHPRRTLDQYYYSCLPDTSLRDRDQIINHRTPHVLMVDQLWLWVTNRGICPILLQSQLAFSIFILFRLRLETKIMFYDLETIVTFFPENREADNDHPKPHLKHNFADLRDSIAQLLDESPPDRDVCTNAYELAALIMQYAVTLLLGPKLMNIEAGFRVLQIFRETIAETVCHFVFEYYAEPDSTNIL